MNRQEFLKQLEVLLSDISQAERDEALQYYNDYLDDAGIENEETAIRALGSPSQVAANIKEGLKEGTETGEDMEKDFSGNTEEKEEALVSSKDSQEEEKALENTHFADGNTDGVFDAILGSGGANADIERMDAQIRSAAVVDAAVVNADTVNSESCSEGMGDAGKESADEGKHANAQNQVDGFANINPDPFRGLYKDIDSCQIHGKEQNTDYAQAGQEYQDGGRDRKGYQNPNGYGNPNGEPNTGGYQNQGGYQYQNDYPNPDEYRSGCHSSNGYQNQGGCQNPNGYQNQGGYQNPNGYQSQNGYQNPNRYQNQGGYQNPNGHQGQNGYQNPNGYQNQGGYKNPNGYQNQNGYQYQNQGGPDGCQYQNQYQNPYGNGGHRPPKKKRSTGEIALIVLLCIFALPVIIPLGIAAVAVVFGLVVSVIAVIGSLVIAGVAVLIAGIVLVITAFLKLFLMPAAALYLLGKGLLCTGIGLAMTSAMIWVAVKLVPVMCRGFVNLCKWPFTRRNAA